MIASAPDTPPAPLLAAARPLLHQFQEEFCFAYLVADPATHHAALVDPRADQVDVYLGELEERGLTLAWIVETHTHADHLSGAAELRRRTGAEIAMSANAHSDVATRKLNDGDRIELGDVALAVLASPGHTDDSLSLRAGDTLLTGDALLIGGAGRTDFQAGSPESLHHTLHERFAELPGDLLVYPGHDYKGHRHTTLERERETNPLFRLTDRAEFTRTLRAAKQPKPADMDAILKANIRGLKPSGIVTVETLSRELRSDAPPLLVDVRTPAEFRATFIDESLLMPLETIGSERDSLDRNRELVLVCRTGSRAHLAAVRFDGMSVRVLDGGIVAWLEAGLPVIEGKKHMSLERQVRVLAGAMAAVGGALALLVSPWFAAVPTFVGLGLVYAGVTDKCGMALVLGRMPWNQVEEAPPLGACAAPVGACAAALPEDPA